MISLTGRYLFIVIGALLGWIVFFACSDGGSPSPGNGSQNTPMIIETDLPTNYHIDNPPQHRFGLTDQDGISDGLVAYTENDNLVWEKNLENFNSNSWDTTWTPNPTNAGTASLEWYVKDNFQEGEQEVRTGKHEIQLLSPEPDTNTPTEFSAEIPTFKVGETGEYYFTATDKDTLDAITFLETRPDGSTNTFSVTPNSVDWDTTFSRTYVRAGDVNWRITATDKHPNPETREEEYTTTVLEPEANTPTQFTADIPTFTRGEEGTVTFTVADSDTLTNIVLRETRPDGSTHTFNTSLHSVDWDTTIHRTYTEAGEANWTLEATDKHPNQETTEQTYTIQILPTSQTYTLEGEVRNPVLNQPATGVQLELFNQEAQQLDQTTSNAEGRATLQHTQGEEKPTNNHAIRTSGVGYETQNHTIDLASENFSYELTPTQILTSNPGWSIEPRDSIRVNLSDAVDTQGVPLEELVIQNTSSNVSARQDNGNNYWLRVENDASNTQENVELEIRTTTNQKTHSIPITIQPRANINYTNTFFEVQEENTLALNLLEYISSGVDVDSTHISSTDSRLEIIRDAANEYRLIPQQDFSGNIQLDLFASNKHGSETNQTGTLDVQGLPRANITIVGSDDNQPINQGYLIIENEQGIPQDSLTTNNGTINNIKIRTPNNAYLRAGELRNNEPYALEHRIIKEHNGSDIEETIAVLNKEKRNINKNTIGEFSNNDLIRLRAALRHVNANGPYQTFNNWDEGGGDFQDKITKYAQSNNGVNPDEIILTNYITFLHTGSEGWLEQETKDIVYDVWNNWIKPILETHQPAPTFTEVDEIFYDKNNQPEDKFIVRPRGSIPGGNGLISLYGHPKSTLKSGIASLRSGPPDGRPSYNVGYRAAIEELASGLIWMGRLSNEDYLGIHESIINDRGGSSDLNELSVFDMKVGRMMNNPLYKSGQEFDDALIIPHKWK